MGVQFFINYRRQDAAAEAQRLFEAVAKEFGTEAVFLDVTKIPPGSEWPEELKSVVQEAHTVLVVIGPTWLTAGADQFGKRRIEKPEDWVRLELEAAISSKPAKRIIPILVNGGAMPPPEALPASLSSIPTRQNLELRRDNWSEDIKSVIEFLREHADGLAPSRRDRIMDAGEIRIGCIKHPPLCDFNWDGHRKQYSGLYVDLALEVMKDHRLAPIFSDLDWSDLKDAFTTHNFDLVLSVFETDQRKKTADFCAPFHYVSVGAIALKDNIKVQSIPDLRRRDVQISVASGETGWEFVVHELDVPRRNVILTDDADLSVLVGALLAGKADVAVCDDVTCKQLIDGRSDLRSVFGRSPLKYCRNAIMVPPNEPEFQKWVHEQFSEKRSNSKHINLLEEHILAEYHPYIRKFS